VNSSTKLAMLAFLAALASPGYAQQAPKSKAPPHAAQTSPLPATAAPAATPPAENPAANAAPPPGWAARCGSASRDAPLECAIEQSAVLTTGQLIVLVNVRVPSDTHTPVIAVRLPLVLNGLNLPVGTRLQVDDGKTADLQIQTCEAGGCFASAPISPELLAAMKTGKQLKVAFQNLKKETIAVPLPLADFAAAYDKIK
jgi:invasion protein IalB